MKLYAGIDFPSNNYYPGTIDVQGIRIYRKRLPNKPGTVLAEFLGDFKLTNKKIA